jgi:hypothetical protein
MNNHVCRASKEGKGKEKREKGKRKGRKKGSGAKDIRMVSLVEVIIKF